MPLRYVLTLRLCADCRAGRGRSGRSAERACASALVLASRSRPSSLTRSHAHTARHDHGPTVGHPGRRAHAVPAPRAGEGQAAVVREPLGGLAALAGARTFLLFLSRVWGRGRAGPPSSAGHARLRGTSSEAQMLAKRRPARCERFVLVRSASREQARRNSRHGWLHAASKATRRRVCLPSLNVSQTLSTACSTLRLAQQESGDFP